MRSWLTTASAVLASLTVGACLPIPWSYNRSPLITGQLRSGAGPAPGLTVILAEPDSTSRCATPLASVVTDSAGQFQLPAQRQRMHWLPLMGDWVFGQSWVLCARIEGRNINLAQTTINKREKHAQVRCSLVRMPDSTAATQGTCDITY